MRRGTEIRQWAKWYKGLRERGPETFLYADGATGTEQLVKGPNHATLTGPIYINEAEPGDVLEIQILDIVPKVNAFNLNPDTSFLKAGLLPEDFPRGKVRWYKADRKKMKFKFLPGIEIPFKPFPGTIGVELEAYGRWTNLAPGKHGGNIDNKELVAGTVLYIPVWVKGAGLKTGDSHLAQGDGEVNLNGLEGAFKKIALKLTVRKELKGLVNWPMASTRTHWITMGFHIDLLESCKMAVRRAIEFLNKYYGLYEEDAYAFCSMAVDLHVTQVVDFTLGIHAMIPKACFKARKYAKKNGLLLQWS
jgi:acetamidase/formamidase